MRQERVDLEAILIGDIHLSHKPPIARSSEKDWYETQRRYLQEVRDMAFTGTGPCNGSVPVLCAGDIFDDGWRSNKCPPELINFALEYIDKWYCVPGQHDLPHHRLDDIQKSAYWTLVKAGKIIHVDVERDTGPTEVGGVRIFGFPWGCPIGPPYFSVPASSFHMDIAIIHSYIWMAGKGHAQADKKHRTGNFAERLDKYDVAVFGDNHIPFEKKLGNGVTIYNTGSFMRRKMDEITHKPSIGLLNSKGEVKRHYLDVSQDKFLDHEELKKLAIPNENMVEFLEKLRDLTDTTVSFENAIMRYMDEMEVSQEVKEIIISSLDQKE